ncbi:MAG: hypothetical protein EXR75_04485, partial [Myxococcales bacterium]|nr:hypothetical protein [Myxococcales bacterium]
MMRRARLRVADAACLTVAAAMANCARRADPLVAAVSLAAAPVATESALKHGWRYHPPAWEIHDRIRLDDGSWLLVGELGERWISGQIEPAMRRVGADAALSCAPEALRHCVRWAPDRWLFAAESGAVYEASSPTAALTLLARGPASIHAFAGRSGALVAIDALGKLFRFDGAAWHPAPTPLPVHEIAGTSSGRLLALSFPEHLSLSADGGASWQSLDTPRFGAHALTELDDGGVRVRGVSSDAQLSRDASVLVPHHEAEPAGTAVADPVLFTPRRGPSADAILDGRAAIIEGRYFELSMTKAPCDGCDSDKPVVLWSLAVGRLDAALSSSSLELDQRCRDAKIAVRGEVSFIACTAGNESREVLLYGSTNDTRSFARVPIRLVSTSSGAVEIGVANDESAVILGVCSTAQSACAAPILRVALDGSSTTARAPELVGAPSGLTFSGNGKRAYFVGARDKGGEVSAFGSSDDAHSFAPVPFTARGDRSRAFQRRFAETSASGSRRIFPGDGGALGLFIADEPRQYAFVGADGTFESVAEWPLRAPVIALGGSGERLLLAHAEPAPKSASLWESLDAGRSFQRVLTPFSLGLDRSDSLEIACTQVACVLGSLATRVGWASPHRTADSAAENGATRSLAVRASIRCKLADGPAETLHDVSDGRLPVADEAFRGDSSWAALVEHPSTGEVVAVSANRHPLSPPLTRHVLLARAPKRDDVAIRSEAQAEGFVALREGIRGKLRGRLDVATIDFYSGKSVKESFPTQEPLVVGEYTAGPSSYLLAGSLSLSPDGVLVRPRTARPEVMLALHTRRAPLTTEVVEFPTWPRTTRVMLDTFAMAPDPMAIGLVLADHVIAAASIANLEGGARIDVGIAPASSPHRLTRTHWSYRGRNPGVNVTLVERDLEDAASYFVPWDALTGVGEAIATPTQRALATPRPCTSEEVRTTPRVVATFLVGTRHPVIVEGRSEALMSSESILHGTPAAPCTLGWIADSER